MLRNLFKSKEDRGFTIIEVLIVLAIAGVILVVVLVAVPQLQRNQRNESRRNINARIATEINNFASNNRGELPVGDTAVAAGDEDHFGQPAGDVGFFNRYLGCTLGGGLPAVCTSNIEDPTHGVPVGSENGGGTTGMTTIAVDGGTTPAALGTEPGSIGYSRGYICDGELAVANDARKFAVQMRLEGGAISCIDNQ